MRRPRHHPTVVPRACGVSSTPRLLGSIADASGILGRPVKPGDDNRGCGAFIFIKHTSAFPRHASPGLCQSFRPGTRAQGMPGARCTRGLVCKIVRKGAHEHTGSAETLRHPPRNGFTAYGALSSATNSFLSPSSANWRSCLNPVGPAKTSADLTPATGAGTTRFCRPQLRQSSARRSIAHGRSHPAIPFAPDAAAATASHPNVRDDRDTPLVERMRRREF
jgi:hypothetical protein